MITQTINFYCISIPNFNISIPRANERDRRATKFITARPTCLNCLDPSNPEGKCINMYINNCGDIISADGINW